MMGVRELWARTDPPQLIASYYVPESGELTFNAEPLSWTGKTYLETIAERAGVAVEDLYWKTKNV